MPYQEPNDITYPTGIGDKPVDDYEDPCAQADGTISDDVWLHGARDVDAFAESNTAIVDGNLHIGDVDSLAGLACLRQVNGRLTGFGQECVIPGAAFAAACGRWIVHIGKVWKGRCWLMATHYNTPNCVKYFSRN